MLTSAGLLAASHYAGTIIGLTLAVVATRLLGPSDYGKAALILSYPALLSSLLSFKAGNVLTRYLAGSRANGDRTATASLCALGFALDLIPACLVVLGVALTAHWVTNHFWELPETVHLMVAYALSLPFSALLGTSSAVLMTWRRYDLLAAVHVGERLLVLALTGFLLLQGWGLPAVVLSSAVGEAVGGLGAFLMSLLVLNRSRFTIGPKSLPGVRRVLDRRLLAALGSNYWTISLLGILNHTPVMLLGRFRGPEAAGFYRLAAITVVAGGYVETSLARAVYPQLATLWARGHRGALVSQARLWTLGYGLPAALVLILAGIAAPTFLVLIFGHEYQEVGSVAQLLLAATATSTAVFWVGSLYFAAGWFGRWALIHTGYTLVAVAACSLAAATLGLYGVAIATAVAKIAVTVVLVLLVVRWSHLQT